ncbi:MAG: glycosyl transferase [Maricaulis sp.]|jgi:glycosyltransferase involved in cell wall biosynthesis|uniref:Glycosyl transferase n=1 Tax=Maricaulis virginensis TaxID=144022 RepID=A0A9W6IMQ5_9PROT|nr:glycosyltransferase family 4 protein [Maricaulis virginensis]MAZ91577.1 glycosyl transferase [Maricaulis sp.]GLK53178.1 glycosyl transferase [Maricaulis virginensis]
MIVLQVIPELDAGGAERTTLEIAEAVIAEGGRALVASAGGRLEDELAALGGELIRMPAASKNPLDLWRNMLRLVATVRSEAVDIVHARSRAPAWSAKWACDRTDAHFVTTYHGTYNARSSLKRRYNSVMARGERVIANSEFIRDHIATEHPFATSRVRVIPRGVDLVRFDPEAVGEDRLAALRQAWALDPQDQSPLLLLPARLTGWKGQREAIRALGRLQDDPDVETPRLVLAGDAQGRQTYVEELQALAASENVAGRVFIVGHCSDMPAAMMLCDLVLTPSNEPEAFGRTAAEAGAMLKPVIAADHGGAREVVLHGETGWRVPPGDPGALAAAIAGALALAPEDRDAVGQRARAHVIAEFSTVSLQASTLRVYHEVLNSQP